MTYRGDDFVVTYEGAPGMVTQTVVEESVVELLESDDEERRMDALSLVLSRIEVFK